MADKSKIEWCDATWNPVRGCSVVSEGCRNCYAMSVAARFSGEGQAYEGLAYRNESGAHWTGKVRLIHEHLEDPLRWKQPRRIFVNSMSDLFHESLSDQDILAVMDVIRRAHDRGHVFQLLTKRPKRMRDFMSRLQFNPQRAGLMYLEDRGINRQGNPISFATVLKQLWLGVSVEDQKTADERIPLLLETPAAVRWISAEPLLGPIDLANLKGGTFDAFSGIDHENLGDIRDAGILGKGEIPSLDWVVVGGESGPKARGLNLDWPRAIVKDCKSASVPVFVKQLGAHPYEIRPSEGAAKGVRAALANLATPHPQRNWFKDWTLISHGDESEWVRSLRLINKKGGDISEWPPDLQVREFPEAKAVAV